MPLERKEVEIPLNGGLDTKQNTELQDPASFTAMTDLHWNRLGELEKRPTYSDSLTAQGPSVLASSPYVSPSPLRYAQTIFCRGSGGEVCVLTDQHGVLRRRRYVNSSLADTQNLGMITREETLATTETDALAWSPVPAIVRRKFVEASQISSIDTASEFGFSVCTSATCSVDSREIVVVAYVGVIAGSGTGRLRVRAIDAQTWTTIREAEFVSLGESEANVRACPITETNYEGVLVTYNAAYTAPVTIKGIRYDARTNDFIDAGNLTTNATLGGPHALVTGNSGQFYFGFTDNTSGFGTVQTRTFAGGVSSTHTSTRAFSTTTARIAPAIVVGSTNVLIAYVSNVATTVYAETLGNPASSITVTSLGSGVYTRIAAAKETRSGYTHAAAVAAQVADTTNTPFQSIEYALVSFSGAAPVALSVPSNRWIPDAALLGAVSLRGRAHFVIGTNHYASSVAPYATASDVARVLTSGLLVRVHFPYNGGTFANQRVDVVARFMHDRLNANFPVDRTSLSITVTGDVARFAVLGDRTQDRVDAGSYSYYYATSLAVIEVDCSARPMPTARYLDTTFIGGGMLHGYDGVVCSEAAFVCAPTLEVVKVGSGAGSISAATGALLVAAIYVFQDASGNLHRSSPGFAANTETLASDTVDVYVAMPPATSRDGFTHRRIGIELYIVDSAGTYRLANNASSEQDVYDSFLTGPLTGVVFSDVSIPSSGEPQLYSDGTGSAELVAESPPACHSMAFIGDRLWLLDSEDRSRVWPSKPLVAGYAPEFNTANTVLIGDEGVAIEDVGGIPTVFGKRGIWQIYGEGPNALGFGGFSPARMLPHLVECLDAASVCKTPAGVLFRGRRGVYLLGNDLSLQPIGLSVDSAMTVSGAPDGFCRIAYDELANEAHVLDFDGRHYVLSMQEGGKWAEYDNTQEPWVDCQSINGQFWYLAHFEDLADYLRRQMATDDSDYNAATAGWSITTPWIRLDGATGFARIWEIQVSLKTPADLADCGTVSLTYYTREGDELSASWTASDLQACAGNDDVALLRFKPAKQVSGAFKLKVTQGTGSGASAGCAPISMRVIGGVRPGGYRRRSGSQLKAGKVVS